jgi:hypothetical protein
MAFISRQGLHQVFVATHNHPSGPLMICSQPAQNPLLQA